MKLVLIVEQTDGDMPTASVELFRDGGGPSATATASAFDDPIFQLRAAVDAVEESYRIQAQISQ
jgi:hypothetical protein